MFQKNTSVRAVRPTPKAIIVAILVLGVVGMGLRTSAQSNGLGITPKLSYTVKSGEELTDTLFIDNLSDTQPLSLQVKVVDFRPQDETGTPQLLLGKDPPEMPWSLKPYITLPATVDIEAGKSKQVPFTIKFPEGVGAGSYYSAIEYISVTGANEDQVSVAASSATLIFVNIPGSATELLSMVQFGAFEKDKFKSIFSKPPTSFAYRLKNGGNVNERPAGTVIIKNSFGKIIASIENINPRDELALIGQTRRFEVCYPKKTDSASLRQANNCQPLKIKPGKYQAEIVILYGENGSETRQIGAKMTFWYLPLWFIIVFAAVVALILFGLLWLWRRFTHLRQRRQRHHH